VPGADDLVELRRATAGGGLPRDPAQRALERFGAPFELADRRDVTERVALDPAGLRDLLLVAYRGQRRSEAARAATLEAATVTAAAVLLAFRRG